MTAKKIKQENTNKYSLLIYVNPKKKKREPMARSAQKHRKQLHKKRHDWSREKKKPQPTSGLHHFMHSRMVLMEREKREKDSKRSRIMPTHSTLHHSTHADHTLREKKK